MRKVYYNLMRKLTLIVPFLAASLLAGPPGATQQQTSLMTASVESHEGMTITAPPWTDPALYKEDHQALNPLSPEEAADVIMNPGAKDPTKNRKKFPFPAGAPKVGHDKHWAEVEKTMEDAAVQSSIIAPHRAVQGLLYFDLRSQFDLLNSAHLYVPEIVAIEKNRGLLYFEIDLSRSAER